MYKTFGFFAAALALIASSAPAFAQDANLERLKKDLGILEKIIKTSMGLDEERAFLRRDKSRKLRPQDIETTYLAGQGVVMTVQVGHGHPYFAFPSAPMSDLYMDFTAELAAPFPEVFAPRAMPDGLSADEREEWEQEERERLDEAREAAATLAQEAAEISEEIAESMHGVVSELSDEDYVIDRETRDKVRKLREAQRRSVQATRQKARETQRMLNRRQKFSEEERQKLMAELEEYQANLKSQADGYMQQIKEIRTAQRTQWEQKLSELENGLLETICQYGATVQALPDNERFTIVVKKAERESGKPRDLIYVFEKADLMACRDGRISVDGLKSKATRYAF